MWGQLSRGLARARVQGKAFQCIIFWTVQHPCPHCYPESQGGYREAHGQVLVRWAKLDYAHISLYGCDLPYIHLIVLPPHVKEKLQEHILIGVLSLHLKLDLSEASMGDDLSYLVVPPSNILQDNWIVYR
jgi:hypothetical protein